MLGELFGYNLKRKYRSYVGRTIISIARLNIWVATVVFYLPQSEKRRGHGQNEFAATYSRMGDTATMRLIDDVS